MPDSNVQFRSVLHGYDRAQVDQHVNQLAQASAAVWQEAAERTVQVSQLEAANGKLKDEVEHHARRARAFEEAQMEAVTPTYEGFGARIISILKLAEKEALELRTRSQVDAANDRAAAEESALATRQDAADFAMKSRSANDDEVARVLDDAEQQAATLLDDARTRADTLLEDARTRADSLLTNADRQAMGRQDADRQTMARREEAEAVYERARAKSAAAAVDFETTLAARRESSALEFAAQVTAAEQQLAAVRQQAEQARIDCEQTQQKAETESGRQLDHATANARTLVAEAKAKAERIRDNSERELVAATQRRDNVNAQLSIVRRDLAALGGVTRFNPVLLAEPDVELMGSESIARSADHQPADSSQSADATAEPDRQPIRADS